MQNQFATAMLWCCHGPFSIMLDTSIINYLGYLEKINIIEANISMKIFLFPTEDLRTHWIDQIFK